MHPLIKLSKVTKNFHQGNQRIDVLNDINLTVNNGEKIAILGQSGTGKSTMLSLMAGLDLPDLGTIQIDNQNLASLNQDELSHFRSKNIGIVFQQFHLMKHLTALENVSIPLELQKEKNADELARNALNLVKLSHRLGPFPISIVRWGKPTGCYRTQWLLNQELSLQMNHQVTWIKKPATKSWN